MLFSILYRFVNRFFVNVINHIHCENVQKCTQIMRSFIDKPKPSIFVHNNLWIDSVIWLIICVSYQECVIETSVHVNTLNMILATRKIKLHKLCKIFEWKLIVWGKICWGSGVVVWLQKRFSSIFFSNEITENYPERLITPKTFRLTFPKVDFVSAYLFVESKAFFICGKISTRMRCIQSKMEVMRGIE